jgi:hypothetical protein
MVTLQARARACRCSNPIMTFFINPFTGQEGDCQLTALSVWACTCLSGYTGAFRGSLTGPDSIASPGAPMTSPTQPPVADAASAEPTDLTASTDASADSETPPAIPAFKFPFKPGELAAAKSPNQPWYKNGAKNGHTKVPGAAPPGTRRSMGKR